MRLQRRGQILLEALGSTQFRRNAISGTQGLVLLIILGSQPKRMSPNGSRFKTTEETGRGLRAPPPIVYIYCDRPDDDLVDVAPLRQLQRLTPRRPSQSTCSCLRGRRSYATATLDEPDLAIDPLPVVQRRCSSSRKRTFVHLAGMNREQMVNLHRVAAHCPRNQSDADF